MDPVYRNMQSYPYQKDEIRYGPHYYPGAEAIPTQMHAPRPPMSHGCWPWGSNYGYGSQMGCHGCCNHTYFPPHYAWGSPYSHVPPHHYPSFPVHYMPPPPFYQHPWYENEKNVVADHHCCGCPNHPFHHQEQKNVRIEEEEPEGERRKDDSVVPFKFKNSPYPIAWIPPDFSGNKEQANTKDGSRDAKVNEDEKIVEQRPTFWNGWYPLDLNNLVSSKQRGDGEEGHQQVDGKRNFPFPVVWIPYKPEEKEKEQHKVKDFDTKPSLEWEKAYDRGRNEEAAARTKDIPVKEAERVEKKSSFDQAASRAKDIPVKEVEHVEKKSSIDQAASRAKHIPVKEVEHVEKKSSLNQQKERASVIIDNGEKKLDSGETMPHKDVSKRNSPPPKSSKLPPVCLRVDPLPRRKTANGKSRSPSSPGDRPKPSLQSNEPSKVVLSSLVNNEQDTNEVKEEKGRKTIEVVDARTLQGKTEDVDMGTPVKLPAKFQDDISMNQAEENPSEEHTSRDHSENGAVINDHLKDAGSARGEIQADEVKKYSKRELSEEEAAVIIQSGYRGFDVRRWEPVKKLKQIAQVRQEIPDVKHLIREMEMSSDSQGRSKQRNIIAESIMSLLLKLDAIQGLHPSVREVRKSVVRELVSLQEKLESLVNEKPENSPGEESVMRCDEYALNKSEDFISSQNGTGTSPTDILEAHQNQTDGGSNCGNSASSEADVIGNEVSEKMEKDEVSEKMEKEAAESSTVNGVDSVPEPTIKDEEEESSEVVKNDETSITKEDHEGLAIDLCSEYSSARGREFAPTACDTLGSETDKSTIKGEDEKSTGVIENDETSIAKKEDGEGWAIEQCSEFSSATAREFAPAACDTLGSELDELPQRVFDDFCGQEGTNHVAVEADIRKARERKQIEEELIEPPLTLELHCDASATYSEDNKTVEIHEVPNLPCSGINYESKTKETTPISEFSGNCKSVDKFGTEEQVMFEPDECASEQQTKFIADMFEPPKASDDSELPTAEACMGVYNIDPDENSGMADSIKSLMLEEPSLHKPTEKEMSSQLLHEYNLDQETSLISVSANTPEAVDMIGVEGAAETKSDISGGTDSYNCITERSVINDNSEEASEEIQPQITKVEGSADVQERDMEHPLSKETLVDASGHDEEHALDPTMVQVTGAGDEVAESNRKLIEENEKLREMMQKLIKSGQDQLMEISSLSGRVKELERKLSKKRKLKIRQNRGGSKL